MNDESTILRAEALVLRKVPFSRTSHIVTWLTPDQGPITTLIKGAYRPKSLFLGQYDIGYTCELLFYARERNGMHIARECSPLNSRDGLRRNWRVSLCALYLCDLLSAISVPGSHQPNTYALATTALDFLCSHQPRPPFIFWFELRLAGTIGLAPRLDSCTLCGRPFPTPSIDSPTTAPDGRDTWIFSAAHGGVTCRSCSAGSDQARPDAISVVTPDVLALLRRWQTTESPRSAQNTRCSRHQFLAFQRLLGVFLSFHLDLALNGRLTAIGLLGEAAIDAGPSRIRSNKNK